MYQLVEPRRLRVRRRRVAPPPPARNRRFGLHQNPAVDPQKRVRQSTGTDHSPSATHTFASRYRRASAGNHTLCSMATRQHDGSTPSRRLKTRRAPRREDHQPPGSPKLNHGRADVHRQNVERLLLLQRPHDARHELASDGDALAEPEVRLPQRREGLEEAPVWVQAAGGELHGGGRVGWRERGGRHRTERGGEADDRVPTRWGGLSARWDDDLTEPEPRARRGRLGTRVRARGNLR